MRLALPEPATVTPPAADALSEPLLTVSVTLTALVPASTSVTDRPIRASGVSSLAE